MKFCPKCGNLMLPDRKRKVWVCRVCGYEEPFDEEKDREKTRITQKVEVVHAGPSVYEGEEYTEKVTVMCPNCGKKVVALYIVLHLPVSDDEEEEVIVYKCTECGHVWRESD